jgi:hypothetical protein
MRIASSLLLLLILMTAAEASSPSPRSMEGCIVSGRLISKNRYPIQVRDRIDGPNLPLAHFEGSRVRFDSGYLLPGDVYIRQSGPHVVGRCEQPRP